MKFPYGISDFRTIITEGYCYLDRTDRIARIEEAGRYLLFIRPRRFGKSLWLSTLRYYYDVAWKDQFERLFGALAVGRAPTPLAGQYLVLQWDLSCVDAAGSLADIRKSLHNHINACISNFYADHRAFFPEGSAVIDPDAISTLKRLLSAARAAGHPIYLLIDEYDNFANELMTGVRDEREDYRAMVHEKGPLKTLFKAVKSAAGEGAIDRIFITGVSPVVMSDITSGFNIAENIFLDPEFNDLCGFTESEVADMLASLVKTDSSPGASDDVAQGLSLMRTYYDGYAFAPDAAENVYNPTLVLYFLNQYRKIGSFPREMLDANLATDEAKLDFAGRLPNGHQLILELVRETEPVAISGISNRFGVSDMLEDAGKTRAFVASFLYYFGVLSIAGITAAGKLEMRVPNLVTRGLCMDCIARRSCADPPSSA